MDQFREIELFVQVAESGSISKAAEVLDLSTSAASRYLVALESRLGVQLVQRTTRRLFLTEAGAEFHRRCKGVLADMREAEATVMETVVNPTGLLRVTASLSFCMLHIAPLLPEFTARYPDITVDVVAANRYYDIIDNGVDVAIRTRQFEADSNITIRRLAETRRILAASPAYLAQHGVPTSPEDLHAHNVLTYAYAIDPHVLPFKRAGKTTVVKVKPLLDANDGQILRNAALDDMGILVQPKYIVYDDIVQGRLVPVLDDWDLPRLTMNIAFQTRRHMPAKVRLFIDALVERFRSHDFERLWTA
ncbi:MAG: LysR family transcriptional regulator [Pseudogulbenkiania sp.]|nr:LysR family transcriptional regulator [Pseudogulbenkiania sp.]